MEPNQVQTRTDLSIALDALARDTGARRGSADAALRLKRSTESDMRRGTSLPSLESLTSFLDKYGVRPADRKAWFAARERAASSYRDRFPNARLVGETDPRTLGLHPAIQSSESGDEAPLYVPRDLDTRLRQLVRDGATGAGCFVVLVGSSSVGKTRCAYEAVRAELPDWWLFHPADPAELDGFAADPAGRTVTWLDELRHYLVDGLQPATMRRLLQAQRPVVVIGTLWPELYERFTSLPGGEADVYRSQRQIMDMSTRALVPEQFSDSERHRAAAVGKNDDRIATSPRRYGRSSA